MVDLELYRIFTIVANEKNITKASEKLNISQPAVTKHIKNLENALELRLFNRTNHGIELTSDGQKIYEEAKEAVETLNSIFVKYGKNRNINLGVHVSMYKMFSKILTKFSNINENITINISDTDLINMLAPDLSDMIAKLENEKLDIIIKYLEQITQNTNNNSSLPAIASILNGIINNMGSIAQLASSAGSAASSIGDNINNSAQDIQNNIMEQLRNMKAKVEALASTP